MKANSPLPQTSWLYIKSEPNCYTVGFYNPDGKWEPESDHLTPDRAARRVQCLNGDSAEMIMALEEAEKCLQIARTFHAKLVSALRECVAVFEGMRGQLSEKEWALGWASEASALTQARAALAKLDSQPEEKGAK